MSVDTVRRLMRDWRRLAPQVLQDLYAWILELAPGHPGVVLQTSEPLPQDTTGLRELARLAGILEGIWAQQGYHGTGLLGAVNLWFQGVPGWF